MSVEITLKNYRCFSDTNPATFTLEKGFTGFVGVNNSGKSSVLKFFYEFRDIFQKLSSPSQSIVDAFIGNGLFQYPSSITDHEEVFCNKNNRDIEIHIEFQDKNESIDSNPKGLERVDIGIRRGTNEYYIKLYTSDGLIEAGDRTRSWRCEESNLCLIVGNKVKPWFDLNRLLSFSKKMSNTIYIGPFRNVIISGYGVDYFDIKVGQSFVKQWQLYKTGVNEKRSNEAAYNLTNNIRHIFGFDNFEINPSPDLDTLMLLINGKSYKLLEVGSGIAQFILVFANIAIKEPSFILIDEPELNLHPSLQLDFLTSLGSYATEGVLFATHNYGLVRASADRIYTVQQHFLGESEVSEFEETANLAELMGELNFSGYRDLGFDKVLLVEGTTEVKTIQQFLRLHKVDHKIVLVPMGGKSFIRKSSKAELAELTRLSNNIYALIDSERSSEDAPLQPRIEGFQKVCEQLDIKCHILARRATENYLTENAIQEVKDPKYKALEPYQKLNEVSPDWGKSENWKIAKAMTLQDLEGTDLGVFLEKLASD